MRYVIAGYVIVLTLLFLYGLQLVWRERRLTRAAQRVESLTARDNRAHRSGPAVGEDAAGNH